jgi:hypothetical protein
MMPAERRERAREPAGDAAGCHSGTSRCAPGTTTKSLASQVKGWARRRSPDRRSTGACSLDARRSSVRRSHAISTGRSAVLLARASNRRVAPRRTMIFTLFLIAMQNVVSAFHGPSAVSAEKNCRIQDRRREVCNTVRFCSPRTSAAQPASTHVVRNRTDRTGQPHKAARADSHLDFRC